MVVELVVEVEEALVVSVAEEAFVVSVAEAAEWAGPAGSTRRCPMCRGFAG